MARMSQISLFLLLAGLPFLSACQNPGPSSPKPDANQVLKDYIQIGSSGTGTGQYRNPYGLALDPSGDYLYICDYWAHRILKFTTDGQYVQKWGTEGSGPEQFEYPTSVAVDSSGFVYVASNGRVSKFFPGWPARDGLGKFPRLPEHLLRQSGGARSQWKPSYP